MAGFHRIVSDYLKIGRKKSTENITVEIDNNNGSYNPAFRVNSGTSEMLMKHNGRTTFRRFEHRSDEISGNLVLTEADHMNTYMVNTAAPRSIQLPAPQAGLMFTFKDATGQCATNNITITRPGSEKIDNVAASLVLKQNYVTRTIFSDGFHWYTTNFDPAWLALMPNNVGFASGMGLDFSAVASPGSQTIATKVMTSYMEGSFTAALACGTGTATLNASVRTINWVKVGKLVTLGGRLDLSAVSAPSGTLKITGLPYPAAVDCKVEIGYVIGRSLNSLVQNVYGKVLAGTSDILLEDFQDGDAGNMGNRIIATSSFILGGSYIASS